MEIFVGIIIGLLLGGLSSAGYLLYSSRSFAVQSRRDAEQQGKNLIDSARTAAKEIQLEARHELLKAREEADKETEETFRKIAEQEKRLTKREDTLDRKLDTLHVKESQLDSLQKDVAGRERVVREKEQELDELLADKRQKLLVVAQMSQEEARAELLRQVELECRSEAGAIVQKELELAREESNAKAREIILQAMQRYASEQSVDHTVASVTLTDDAMKGRVIGREGRNIRSFEKASGVDVIIDDTPGVVVVSCFDPVRREVARLSMEKLVADGRIHPGRIEEVVKTCQDEMDERLMKIGKDAGNEVHIPNLAKPLLPMLGRLNYRTSFGQNVLRHSIEVGFIAQMMADQLGLDGEIARRAGLLHDIGKALDHEHEGGHPQIGYELLKKHGEKEEVLNACLAHHGDAPVTTPYTPIVMAADAVSASRPGARRESLERYVQRLKDLETLAESFDGVRQTYAISAGREVRVIVDAKSVDDRASAKLARDIAKRVQEEMSYPGEIKVTVLREVRTVEYAR
ncbi:MAG: ribonuclease Y [Phycisphaerae bacterium]